VKLSSQLDFGGGKFGSGQEVEEIIAPLPQNGRMEINTVVYVRQ